MPVTPRWPGTPRPGAIYLATLGFTVTTIQVFRSDDDGATWSAPVNGTPGGSSEDKHGIAVDNFPGGGNGNVYLASRRFGGSPGIYFFRSTDGGLTFGPSGGLLLDTTNNGPAVAVGPDHSVYVFWHAGTSLRMRKSTDLGLTFGAPVTVASDLVGGTNGDMGFTGVRQGTTTAVGFRSNQFPRVAVNPANGHLYAVYNNDAPGADKADVFFRQSTDGGATWSAAQRVNDDVTTTDQWHPAIAVTPDGGSVGVFYYSREVDPANNNLFRYVGRLGTVLGGIVTFDPSIDVSQVSSLPEFGRDGIVNSVYMGDSDQIDATDSRFHVTWSDNRDDLAGGAGRKDPNVYYAALEAGLHVTTTTPAAGSVISTQPTVFVVNVSEPLNAASVHASDFAVNGIPATAVAYTPGTTTLSFTFASTPITVQGLQTMHVNAGAFTASASGDPVLEYDRTFRYDTVTLSVISTVPAAGGLLTLPSPLTLDLNFNEPVDPASVQTADLGVSGIAGALVTGATLLPGNTTVRFTLNVAAEGTLSATLGAGVLTDPVGGPNAAFAASYLVDSGTVSYPVPLAGKNPPGSLVYDPSVSGTFGAPGDIDSFTIAVDPNQTITAIVTPAPGLQPTVTLADPSSAVIGSATAAAAGQAALIQTAPATTGGTYTLIVGGAAGTIGGYTLQVVLNAAQEEEGLLAGVTNDTLATAQNIDASLIAFEPGVSRGAVLGATTDSTPTAQAVPFVFEDISATGTVIAGLTNVDDSFASVSIGFPFPFFGANQASVFVSSNGLLTFGTANTTFTNSDLTTVPAQGAIAVFWDDLHTAGGVAGSNVFAQVLGSGPNQHLTIQWNKVRFFSGGTAGDTITFQAQLFADGRVALNYLDLVSGLAAGNNGASATTGLKDVGTQGPRRVLTAFNNGPNTFVGTGQSTLFTVPAAALFDLYAVSLGAGDVATLALNALASGTINVELLDSTGVVAASGVAGPTNIDKVISNFVVPAAGTYYARVSAAVSLLYNLVITSNAAFDTEPNDSFATARPLAGNRGALGSVVPSTLAYLGVAQPFVFEDISATGTVIAGLTGVDDSFASVPIGFSFPFFNTTQTNVFVSSNGLLTFGAANSTFTNTDLTTVPGQDAIAVFWDDLHTAGGVAGSNVFSQVLGSGPNQHLTIQWNKIRFFSGGTAGDTITFQAQLFADGRIIVNHLDLVSGSAAGNNGASATLGIKAAGTQGPDRLLLAFNNGPNAFVGTGLSTGFVGGGVDDWYSLTLSPGQTTLALNTSTPADGPGEIVNLLNPRIELYSPANALIASGTVMADGRNEQINAAALTPGTYRVRVSSEGGTQGEYYLSTGGNASSTFTAAGSTLVGESCAPTNSAIDPGERVMVNLRLLNSSGSATTNLVATLLTGGGVLAPTGPLSYGALAPGGTAGRDFSFTADATFSPGQIITATLQLQDGAANLGTVSFAFVAGPAPCGTARLVVTSSIVRVNATQVRATIAVQNIGATTAQNVDLTTARIGVTSGTPLPQALGSILPGDTVKVDVDVANSTPGAMSTLTAGGTFTGGTFTSTQRIRIP
jgi:hypothetical protein